MAYAACTAADPAAQSFSPIIRLSTSGSAGTAVGDFNGDGNPDIAAALMQYFGYLRRDPPGTDYAGHQFWLGKLNEFQGDFIRAEMVKAFLSADEYRRRFGQ